LEDALEKGMTYEDLTPEYIKKLPGIDDSLKTLAINMIENEKKGST